MFGLLQNHRLVFQGRREVGGGVWSFSFEPEHPVQARAGQHGLLNLGGAARKPFSLASAPEEANVLIGTSLRSGSAFKQRLAALTPGDRVSLRGPIYTASLHGSVNTFNFDRAAPQVVLLAQGVGITPFRSLLSHAALVGLKVESSLIHVAPNGHAFRDDTERWATTAAYLQHTADFRAAATAAAQATPQATFFIAGATPFVSSTAALLHDAGVPGAQIRKDKYLGYKPLPHKTTAAATGPASQPSAADPYAYSTREP